MDYVVNFAAESHVDRSIEDPQIFLQTNVLGTSTLLCAARKAWTVGDDIYKDGVKYLQVSTDEVYGSLGAEGFFWETTPLAPNSPYSASKASADLLVRAYFETYKLPVFLKITFQTFPNPPLPITYLNSNEFELRGYVS